MAKTKQKRDDNKSHPFLFLGLELALMAKILKNSAHFASQSNPPHHLSIFTA